MYGITYNDYQELQTKENEIYTKLAKVYRMLGKVDEADQIAGPRSNNQSSKLKDFQDKLAGQNSLSQTYSNESDLPKVPSGDDSPIKREISISFNPFLYDWN